MPRRKNLDAPFQSITGASYRTGISTAYIRSGCKDGTIPHIRVGTDYRVNMPLWLAQLNEQSAQNSHGGELHVQ